MQVGDRYVDLDQAFGCACWSARPLVLDPPVLVLHALW